MKKIRIEYILPTAVFILSTLFIHTIILHKSIMEIDWIFYIIFFAVSAFTGYLCKKIKKKH